MTLVKHNLKQFDNLFDEMLHTFPATWGKDMHWNVPAVNIYETNEAFKLEMVAPGLKKEDIKIGLEKNVLTIGYEHKPEAENKEVKTHKREFRLNSFKRNFVVDDKVNIEGIEAKYEDGVLRLLLPKKEEVKVMPKEISVQ